MIQFDAAPPVPLDYPLLRALTPGEIGLARAAGYVADGVDPGAPVRRAGRDNCTEPSPDNDLRDWRTRMYVIWFCYVYENFAVIAKPLSAIEELILEFKASDVIDIAPELGRVTVLGSLYAGAGGWEPTTPAQREWHIRELRPNYLKAISLLQDWNEHQK
ncbi:MAG TPA: hypothetical protein VKQ73_02525 [Stellaceae bacterium]|nr:hypothetical protein [Stellaceae bacterium]